jgi:chromosome segregation ATPase
MNNDELKRQLNELHKELERAHTLGPEEKDRFGSLMSEMVEIAQGEEGAEETKETLREKLEHKASDFDAEHPRLAGVLRQVIDALGKMGI